MHIADFTDKSRVPKKYTAHQHEVFGMVSPTGSFTCNVPHSLQSFGTPLGRPSEASLYPIFFAHHVNPQTRRMFWYCQLSASKFPSGLQNGDIVTSLHCAVCTLLRHKILLIRDI